LISNIKKLLWIGLLVRYIDGDEKDINSASAEDDDPSSEESSGSYEHIPHGPPPGRDGYHYPQYPPPPRYPGYRRGKSLKTKNKVKLADGLVEKAGGNGTTTEGGNSTVSVGSQKRRSARLDVQEKQEKSEFVARKTRELNVVRLTILTSYQNTSKCTLISSSSDHAMIDTALAFKSKMHFN